MQLVVAPYEQLVFWYMLLYYVRGSLVRLHIYRLAVVLLTLYSVALCLLSSYKALQLSIVDCNSFPCGMPRGRGGFGRVLRVLV